MLKLLQESATDSVDQLYQLYFHKTPDTQEIFYVGIGNSKRPFDFRKSGWGARSKFWWNIVEKHGSPIVIIEHENLTFEKALELEVYYIHKFGRRDLGTGTLVNHTDGGEGCKNWGSPSERIKRCQKISNGIKKWWSSIPPDERSKHAQKRIDSLSDELLSEISSKSLNTWWSKASESDKKERMKKLHEHDSMSSEKRSFRAKEVQQKMSPEKKTAAAQKREANMTAEQKQNRSNKLKEYYSKLSEAEKLERKRKAWETRKIRATKK